MKNALQNIHLHHGTEQELVLSNMFSFLVVVLFELLATWS